MGGKILVLILAKSKKVNAIFKNYFKILDRRCFWGPGSLFKVKMSTFEGSGLFFDLIGGALK